MLGAIARQDWGLTLLPLVVIATKGRRREVENLVDVLKKQTVQPTLIVVVGAGHEDLPVLDDDGTEENVVALEAPRLGASAQRNFGVAVLANLGFLIRPTHFVVFFDDDFVPAPDWLEIAAQAFMDEPEIAGVTGRVLADGIKGDSIPFEEAISYIDSRIQPRKHWSSVSMTTEVESLYGCNMAVTAAAAMNCQFDEGLPLYSWQEDCDFSGQARRIGKTVIIPSCRGVHLGVKSARVSGKRMGYSQIANPIRIANRGNMRKLRAARFVLTAIAANVLKSIVRNSRVDHVGRLSGNVTAICDILSGRLDSRKILEFK